jgi:hypothetical protein
MRIMYVCDMCADGCPESCGHYDRHDLRVMPTGEWLCDSCFDDWEFDLGEDDSRPRWSDFSAPPEYVPASPRPSDEPLRDAVPR